VHNHLEGENRLEDDEHRAEVTEASEKQFRTQMILDKIAEDGNVQVSQDELTQYLIQSAAQYGMAPQEFVEALQSGNQLPALVGEVARNKALAVALGRVTVVDSNGAPVDLSGFVAVEDEPAAEADVVEEAEEIADAAADADEVIEAEEKPKKKAPAKKKAAAKE
jgi:trigger factor